MEHEIAGQAVKAAMDGALVGTADRKKEPMTEKKALKAMERVMNALFFICGMVAVAFVLLISIYLIISGLPAILEIGPINFLFGTRWYASTGDFGIFAIILTSFAGTAGAILVGVPIGLMTAIFLSKVAPPKFAAVVHAAVELLAGIPSVVYGLVGMILLDYVLAFTLLGLAGAIAKPFKNRLVGVAVGTAAVCGIRFLCSFLSGVLIWGNLSDGLPAWTYSLTYNGSYMLPETILTTVAAVLIYKAAPQLFAAQEK